MICVDGREMPWHEGMTMADLLKKIKNSHVYAVVRINDTAPSPALGLRVIT